MSYRYRVNSVSFSGQAPVSLGDMVVIVGPNNSGKSRSLKDILSIIGEYGDPLQVVTAASFTLPDNTSALEDSYGIKPAPGSTTIRFHWLKPAMSEGEDLEAGFNPGVWPDLLRHIPQEKGFARFFGRQLSAFLRTDTRLTLAAICGSSTDEKCIGNLLQALYAQTPAIENKIREEIGMAFGGLDVKLDFATSPSHLQFRVGPSFKGLPPDPREARPILMSSDRLDTQGDGLRSYVAIITAVTTLWQRPVILVDEPEAFLHPPQAYRIGEYLAKQAINRQIIVATHSADVLRGIVFNHPNAQIIRIERTTERAVVRQMEQQQLREMALSPLLSAAGVLNGLFYSAVVVTEAAADARFYQGLLRRIKPDADVYFVDADNKQTVPKIMARYKQMGVACAGIVDIDVLNDKMEFKAQLDWAGVDEAEANALEQLRNEIQNEVVSASKDVQLKEAETILEKALNSIRNVSGGSNDEKTKALAQLKPLGGRLKAESSAWKDVKGKGGRALQKSQASFNQLITRLATLGLFVAPFGELEAALAEYGVAYTNDKRSWIESALQLVPNLEPDPQKEPWKFVRSILAQLKLPV
jgi:hypothetical protein